MRNFLLRVNQNSKVDVSLLFLGEFRIPDYFEPLYCLGDILSIFLEFYGQFYILMNEPFRHQHFPIGLFWTQRDPKIEEYGKALRFISFVRGYTACVQSLSGVTKNPLFLFQTDSTIRYENRHSIIFVYRHLNLSLIHI